METALGNYNIVEWPQVEGGFTLVKVEVGDFEPIALTRESGEWRLKNYINDESTAESTFDKFDLKKWSQKFSSLDLYSLKKVSPTIIESD